MSKMIITGFARSGTSLLAGFLKLLGYDVGGTYNELLKAGWEDEQTQKIVTTFQCNPFSEELILCMVKEIEKVDKMIVKHPRFLMVPELLRIWQGIFPDITVLITYREPFYALQSKKSHGNLGYYTSYSPAELDEIFHTFVDTLLHLRIKHHVIYFPDFLSEYDEIYHAISSLGIHIDKDRGREIWHNLVDFDKVHFK